MWPYWLLFALSAWGALATRPRRWTRPEDWLPLAGIGIILTLMIGFRYRVGADWTNYLAMLYGAGRVDWSGIWTRGDPGYSLVNWIAYQWGLNVWAPNLVCGALFTAGLVAFCRRQPQPLLSLAVAVPYLVIVVAMGYSRQGVAIGFALLAFNALRDQSILRFMLFMALAASFHATAVLLIPIGLASIRRYRIFAWSLGIPVGYLLYTTLLEDKLDTFVAGYLDARMQSQGAFIRTMMNALPAGVFLAYRARFHLPPEEERLWSLIALGALGLVVLLFVLPSSTAVDRIGLYFVPLQIFVLGRLPLALARTPDQYRLYAVGILAYLAAVMFVWLFFATHASAWVPYRLFPMREFFLD